MLQLFKNTQLAIIFATIAFLFIFYTGNFFGSNLPDVRGQFNSLSVNIMRTLESSRFLVFGLSMLLILWQAYMINFIVDEFKLSKKSNYISIPCAYVLLFAFASNEQISPMLFGNSALVLGFFYLLASYDKKASLADMFNAGFWLGISCLLCIAFAAYFPLFLVGLLIMRGLDWREVLLVISGWLTPLFFVGTLFFLKDDFSNWWYYNFSENLGTATLKLHLSTSAWVSLAAYVFIFGWSLVNINKLQLKTTIREQKYIQILLLMPLFALLSFFTQQIFNVQSLALWVLPLSILLSLNLNTLKSNGWAELIYLLLFLTAIAAQYQHIFFV